MLLNIESSSFHLYLWDIEQLLEPVEQPLAHQHHVALLVLGVHVDVDTDKNQQPAERDEIQSFIKNFFDLPVDIMNCKGFGEEYE